MRFFDRKNYQEGLPSNDNVDGVINNNVGNRKRNANQFSWNSLPTDTHSACGDVNGAALSRMRTSLPLPEGSEYLGLPPPGYGARSPTGGRLPSLPPIHQGDSVNWWLQGASDLIFEIEPSRASLMDHADDPLADLVNAEMLARGAGQNGIINSLTPRERARQRNDEDEATATTATNAPTTVGSITAATTTAAATSERTSAPTTATTAATSYCRVKSPPNQSADPVKSMNVSREAEQARQQQLADQHLCMMQKMKEMVQQQLKQRQWRCHWGFNKRIHLRKKCSNINRCVTSASSSSKRMREWQVFSTALP